MNTLKKILAGCASFVLTIPVVARAHEAYVIDVHDFWSGLQSMSFSSFEAIQDPQNIRIAFSVIVGVVLVFVLNVLFMRSEWGSRWRGWVERLSPVGVFAVRLALSISLFVSAYSQHFLGPELALAGMPFTGLVRASLFVSSICIFLGLFTEVAALLALTIYGLAFATFGTYMFTYFNYVGGLLVLILIGNRYYSLDAKLFGQKSGFDIIKKYDTVIIRVCFAIAIIFTAVTVKLMHSDLTIQVVEQYNLTRFYMLFPSDPLLVALGAGLVEVAIGLLILIGFQLRLTILISFFYLTLSLMFFGEAVWPHLLLYGISIRLLTAPEKFAFDNFVIGWKKKTVPQNIEGGASLV